MVVRQQVLHYGGLTTSPTHSCLRHWYAMSSICGMIELCTSKWSNIRLRSSWGHHGIMPNIELVSITAPHSLIVSIYFMVHSTSHHIFWVLPEWEKTETRTNLNGSLHIEGRGWRKNNSDNNHAYLIQAEKERERWYTMVIEQKIMWTFQRSKLRSGSWGRAALLGMNVWLREYCRRLSSDEVYRLEKEARRRVKYVGLFTVLNTLPNLALWASFKYRLPEDAWMTLWVSFN